MNALGVPFPVEFVVVAHQDDWQLFQGNQTASSAQTAAKLVIVYVTAGDAGSAATNPAYYLARETASNASVDSMTVAGLWSCASLTLNTHPILRCMKANTVSYYMRLPDGGGEGQGFGVGSIQLLRTGGVATLSAVDGTTTYTSWDDLVATLQALVAFEAVGQLDVNLAMHVHDWDYNLNSSDHPDHRTTGDLTRAASVGRAWNLFWYIGYGSVFQPPNLTPAEHDIKWKLIVAYDDVMKNLMGTTIIGTSHAEDWSQRTIFRSELSDGTPIPPLPPSAPRAPTNLQTAPFNGTRIDLTWTDNAGDEQGFRIERAPDVGGVAGTYVQIASVAANVTTYRNTGVVGNTRYWYRVRAYNALGNSGYSNEAWGMVTAPLAPTALVATAVNGVRIDLAWIDNSPDEQGFRIERAPDVGGVAGTYVQIAQLARNYTTYSSTGLQNGTTYWYRVRAYNAVGPSAYTNEATATTLAPPAAPSVLQAVPFSHVRIDLTWTDNATDEQGFRIERAPDVSGVPGTFAQIASVAANVTTYSSTGLAGSTRYWYRVRAYSAVGNSPYSNTTDATTLPTPPPAAPTALVATTVSGVRIDLAWTDNAPDEQGFRIERAPDVSGVAGTYVQIASVGVNGHAYSSTGLENGTRYWYRVYAYNAVGPSGYSNEASATTLPRPVAPTLLQATAFNGVRIDLVWTDNATDEQGFRIERAPDAGGVPGPYAQIASVAANVTTYSNTGLQNGTTYWYRVRAYNAVGPSAYTNEATATTLAPPAAPSVLQAVPFSHVRIDL